MVPPYTIIDGRFSLPIAIIEPGMFLSQPGKVIKPVVILRAAQRPR